MKTISLHVGLQQQPLFDSDPQEIQILIAIRAHGLQRYCSTLLQEPTREELTCMRSGTWG